MFTTLYDGMYRYRYLCWLAVLALPAYWLMDRAPPFKVIENGPIAATRAGDVLNITRKVKRDVSRSCDVHFTRYLIDSSGIRHDYGGTLYMSAESRAALDKMMGPYVKTSLTVPQAAAPGMAMLTTDMEYECNPIHALWPIKVSARSTFEVLPALGTEGPKGDTGATGLTGPAGERGAAGSLSTDKKQVK